MRARLRVLIGVLALLTLVLVLQQLGVFRSSGEGTLSARERRDATAALGSAKPLPSYRRHSCVSSPAICFQTKRPLAPMTKPAALALVQRFGLPLRGITPLDCSVHAPLFRGRHLLSAQTACMGVAEVGHFVAFFAVTSIRTDCRALADLAGTQVTIGITRVGEIDHAAVEKVSREFRRLDADAGDVARNVVTQVRAKTVWPTVCR